jgi:hypothetical protein
MEEKLTTAITLLVGMYIGQNWSGIKAKIVDFVKTESVSIAPKQKKESEAWIK